MTATEGMREISFRMSNFDMRIDEGLEAALRAEPMKVFGRHAAWNFNGLVWFDGEQFVEEVWVYRSPREAITAQTLAELMVAVNEKYGSD